MNATRNRVKMQNRQLNSSLEWSELEAKREKERKKLREKLSEILFDLGKLVFGGVIVGGVFEEPETSIWLYVTGILAFCILMLWGYYVFAKSVKEK